MKLQRAAGFVAVLIVLFLGTVQVQAGWKEKVTTNQMKATEYILSLKQGADPDTLERPSLRRVDSYKGKQANSDITEAMDAAVELARAGKHNEIKEPEFAFKGIEPDRYEELQEQKKKSR